MMPGRPKSAIEAVPFDFIEDLCRFDIAVARHGPQPT
jgi:hypothetical protein